MNPAVINAGVQVALLIFQQIQQYSNGQLTEAQALSLFTAASNSLDAAINAFNAAKDPNAAS